MIRAPGTLDRLPRDAHVRLYGLCTFIDPDACRLTLSLDAQSSIVDYSLILDVIEISTGIYYCFFGILVADQLLQASTGYSISYNIQWPLVKRFIALTDKIIEKAKK
jgi:hypothetical protein